jgi:glycosyltransferase involved in cell wall biosynthesis
MTFARPERENRLRTQVVELQKLGFQVDTLGFGNNPIEGVSKHIRISYPPRPARQLREAASLLAPTFRNRFRLVRGYKRILKELRGLSYDLVINHDLELLPLIADPQLLPPAFRYAIKQIDLHELHEYQPSPMSGMPWPAKILESKYRRYQEWLISLIASDHLELVTVVAPRIARWYEENLGVKNYLVVRNVCAYRSAKFEPRSRQGIDYLHHGSFSAFRSPNLLVEASLFLKPEDSINFMFTGNPKIISEFKAWALSVNPRVRFHEAAPPDDVPGVISRFDAEIVFYEPKIKNLLYTLPNKVFEAIQGHLGIISGPSPELQELTETEGVGFSIDTWDAKDLGLALASITRKDIEVFRERSHDVSRRLSPDVELGRLVDRWKKLLLDRSAKAH